MSMKRPTPEEEAEIRNILSLHNDWTISPNEARMLVAEIDALREMYIRELAFSAPTIDELLTDNKALREGSVEVIRERDRLSERLEKLRKALDWYSDGVYPGDESEISPGILRSGKRARLALLEDDEAAK